MARELIIGRLNEKAKLERAFKSPDPEFISIYGRRRVGKTHLVREFFGDNIFFEIVGIHNVSLRDQLDNFSQALGKSMGIGIQPKQPVSWAEAFGQLEQFLESSSQKKRKGKRVVFLDELPWLNTPRSKFLASLEHFWNSWGSRQRDLLLVVCGSAASWMIQKIIRAKGGLHNRLTDSIALQPFTLCEAKEYLESRGVTGLTLFQIVEIYMVMGGIPHYLKQVENGLSSAQIIDRTCFASHGSLRHEFEKLYSSLFNESEQHLKIVKTLSTKRKGMTRSDIIKSIGLHSGGTVSHRLEELEESGFIQSLVPFGKTSKDTLYRLSDEYTLFYIFWIRNLGRRSPGEGHWLTLQNSPRRRAWAGYTFENICIKHLQGLKKALGISGVETAAASWIHHAQSKSEIPGAQVDLVIDRRDQTINLCEMKFSESTFMIDKRYAKDLRRKIDVFRKVTKTRKNVFLTMVTTYGITDNAYAKELVTNSLTLKDLY
jgi:AAA+ ATPase superfamily predicted ATPase